MDDFMLLEYELVRTELRHFQRNQITIISILVTATISLFAYGLIIKDNIIIVTGFIIPALFAVLGTLWIDQIYRQRELALYSYSLEVELSSQNNTKGWEHYIQRKRAVKSGALDKNRNNSIIESLFESLKSPSISYYLIFSAGSVGVPVSSIFYCMLHVKSSDLSTLYMIILGFILLTFQICIEAVYVKNILSLQGELRKMVCDDEHTERTEPLLRSSSK